MKVLLKILLGSTILFSFSQCGSSKSISDQLETKAPFSIEKATYIDWVAGVKGGGSGTNVVLVIKDDILKNIEVDSMFFRAQKVKIEVKDSRYIGRFINNLSKKKDYVLHKDSQKEFGNQAPIVVINTHFELEENEAVISYKEKGRLKYYKIILEKGEQILYQ